MLSDLVEPGRLLPNDVAEDGETVQPSFATRLEALRDPVAEILLVRVLDGQEQLQGSGRRRRGVVFVEAVDQPGITYWRDQPDVLYLPA